MSHPLFIHTASSTPAFWIGLIGILFIIVGALVVINAEFSFSIRPPDSRFDQIDEVQTGKEILFEETQIQDGQPGFDAINEVIVRASKTKIDPVGIYTMQRGTLGRGGQVKVTDTLDGPDHEFIGTPRLVRNWIDNRINTFEERAQTTFRRVGFGLFPVSVTGFVLAYILP